MKIEQYGSIAIIGALAGLNGCACREDHAKIDDAFAALMRANPQYLVGPNGELLMAGAGHSLVGVRAE